MCVELERDLIPIILNQIKHVRTSYSGCFAPTRKVTYTSRSLGFLQSRFRTPPKCHQSSIVNNFDGRADVGNFASDVTKNTRMAVRFKVTRQNTVVIYLLGYPNSFITECNSHARCEQPFAHSHHSPVSTNDFQ